MEPEGRPGLRALFEQALEQPETARAGFLMHACPDAALRAEVLGLLAAHARGGTFLETPLAVELETAFEPGSRIGPYELIAALGQGGMGVVYLARRADQAFRKDVAVKLLRAGFEGPDARRRFRQERQILARLEHPHIARLLDGGDTEDGRPFVVMEHVQGTPIDAYCREARLPIDARLGLMLTVCEAVSFAHRHLVVHRDLKPRNLLVTPEGVPKLLDFGIAKLLLADAPAEESPQTHDGLQPMTLEYASPEQVRGEPVTTASDVYALGVVLYELLTGERPYRLDSGSRHELARAVCEQAPLRPSEASSRSEAEPGGERAALLHAEGGPRRLRRRLQGDLDTILLAALAKAPEERYGSVEDLAEDIRRHLAGFPLLARGERLATRARKFVRRNRVAVAAAVLVTVSLLAGMGATAFQAQRAALARAEAERQRARAERRFADVRRLASAVLFDVHDQIEDLPGATPARKFVATKALEYLDGLARESAGDAALQQELAASYERVAEVLGSLGDAAGMQRSLDSADAIREALSAAAPDDVQLQAPLAISLLRQGDSALAAGNVLAAVARFTRASEQAAKLASRPDLGAQMRVVQADAEGRLCNTLNSVGDTAGALVVCRRQAALLQALPAPESGERKQREAAAWNAHMLGNALRLDGQFEAARRELEAARERFRALAHEDAQSASVGRGLATTDMRLATCLLEIGQPEQALQSFAAAERGLRALVAADPENSAYRFDLAYVLMRRLQPLLAAGQAAEARRSAGEGLALLRRQAERREPSAVDLNEYAWWLATCDVAELRQPARALELATRAVASSPLPNPAILHTLAWAQYRSGQRGAALQTLDRALRALPPSLGGGAARGLRRDIERDRERFRA